MLVSGLGIRKSVIHRAKQANHVMALMVSVCAAQMRGVRALTYVRTARVRHHHHHRQLRVRQLVSRRERVKMVCVRCRLVGVHRTLIALRRKRVTPATCVSNNIIMWIVKMNQQRLALFLIGCIGTRFGLAEGARRLEGSQLLVKLAPLAFLPALGFMVIFVFGLRKSGPETFGDAIWWNNLRPVHAMLYSLFAYSAMTRQAGSWQYLYADVTIGLLAWIIHHTAK